MIIGDRFIEYEVWCVSVASNHNKKNCCDNKTKNIDGKIDLITLSRTRTEKRFSLIC